MGDGFQVIADLDATGPEAPGLAEDLLGRLVAEGIVRAERTGCVLSADLGHPPGPRYADAFHGPDHGLLELHTNGLHVWSGQRVVDPGQGAGDEVGCPHSGAVESFGEPLGRAFLGAIDAWPAAGDADCTSCGRVIGINDWEWEGGAWAFAHLGLTFWNWPPLREDFVGGVGRRLGHRVRLVSGKL
ncbi:hypothetical protein [Dactylosporangium darangshiense]|uniref:Uncharacterized protein n=1 Tax=Dactylosporangium darangshiense TaxID=579108 RepID=A0ABP8DBZ8_9ACTN